MLLTITAKFKSPNNSSSKLSKSQFQKINQFLNNSADGKLLSSRDLAFTLHSRFRKYFDYHKPRPGLLNLIHHNAQSLLPKLDLYKATIIPQYKILSLPPSLRFI